MEFVGNQINGKTVAVTGAVAFLAGRVHLFGSAFPAAVALIAVMLAVSTVYIYLVPVLAAGMWSVSWQGLDVYGDMIAMAACGVFFLFLHRQRFTIQQRTALAATVLLAAKALYYAAGEMLYLLQPADLIRELLALILYMRVCNTAAKCVFAGARDGRLSGERTGLALGILAVSLIGAVDVGPVVFPLWLLLIVTVQYCRGIQPAMLLAALAMVFWDCQGNADAAAFGSVCGGLLLGWFLATWLDGKYRKTMLCLTVFGVVAVSLPAQAYGVAAAMGLLIACPPALLTRFWCAVEAWLASETATEQDLRLYAIRRDLRRKREAFTSLAKLYRAEFDHRQIISYQFQGMARVVDGILEDLAGGGAETAEHPAAGIPVGSASCAFEAVSGDSCLTFSFGKNQQALVISDGMGKGSRARDESRMVVHTLACLLGAGFDVDIAMKTVNAILMDNGQTDRFATVDLAIIDRETGRTRIFKMGAASTFVKRADQVAMLKRPAPPAGIVDGVKLEYIDVRLHRGEMLVMVSDGVTDCDRQDPECQWLRQRLAQIGSRDPETVAELIVNKAAEKYGIRERDDLTVMVAAM